MTFDSLVNRGDYFSAHYLAEVLPKDLKKKDGLFARWTEQEKRWRDEHKGGEENQDEESGWPTPRAGLRALRKPYFKARPTFADYLEAVRDDAPVRPDPLEYKKSLHELHGHVLRALGYEAEPRTLTVTHSGGAYEVDVAYAGPHDRPLVVAIECGWAPDVDAALDPELSGLLLRGVELDGRETIETGDKLASWLLNSEDPPRYVLILAGGVVILADRMTWGEGRYLAVSLDVALGRGTALPDELGTIAALFGADTLLPPEEGGTERLAELLTSSRQHAVGVSKELRDGLRDSVEIIANEVLNRLYEQGVKPADLMEPAAFAKELGRESLRYLYRILFLLYAEARPELHVLPADDEAYVKGYSMARLGDLLIRELVSEESRRGFHFYDSLDLLFRMVNDGYNPRGGTEPGESEGEGLRFEPLKSDLFDPERTRHIGTFVLDDDDENPRRIDTRLRNEALRKVLRLLMLAKGKRKERGGFISYAQLGINQLGAVYEGLMSYTGFIAKEELYEVAKNGDPKDGSWMIPAHKVADYDDSVFVRRIDENGIKTGEWVSYKPGSFVYRLAGRDRQTSASYYTPESLTQVTVQLALQHRLDQDGTTTKAREILDWTICEPALGSGAFLNEAINQVAAEYLKRRQAELRSERLEGERYIQELQKVKAYIALHNSYGVDLNETAVELAEVSLWLNVMHEGLQAPWFGLHLRRGNSLIGAGRRLYAPDALKKGAWLTTAPNDHPFRDGPIPHGHIHHFLLPAQGWGAVAGEKEAKNLAPEEAKQLAAWRKRLRTSPSTGKKRSQTERLQGLARRAEFLWGLVIRRLELSEREISRRVDVWGAEDLPEPKEAIPREEIKERLTRQGSPYWRLKTVMDAWCALWFWPLDKVGLLDGTDEQYEVLKAPHVISRVAEPQKAEEAATTDSLVVQQRWEAPTLDGALPPAQQELALQKQRRKSQPAKPRVKRRTVTPLNSLDDWLDFAEALLGADDLDEERSLFPKSDLLSDLDQYERALPTWMGMEDEWRLEEFFPWLHTVQNIAEQQGFFHWELIFAQIFNKGGFDLQVGNPPWVRPRWEEAVVLAELAPWFVLATEQNSIYKEERKRKLLEPNSSRDYFLSERTRISGIGSFLQSEPTFSLLVGTQPDLYRAFMCRVWNSLNGAGVGALIHPDTHFGGAREGRLRAAAYRHLRLHATFVNAGNWAFQDLVRTQEFGLHVYGPRSEISFVHLSDLYSAQVLSKSLVHDGQGELPGIKYKGTWDTRPHKARVISVDEEVLDGWRKLTVGAEVPVEETPLLYPVTTAEADGIELLAAYPRRLGDSNPYVSSGYHEKGAKDEGLIQWKTMRPESLDDVVLQAPHFAIGTPFYKQPKIPCRTHHDYVAWDVRQLTSDAIPITNYQRAADPSRFQLAQDRWGDSRYTEHYRMAWRSFIDPKAAERSLFAALIPPGPAHVHTVYSMAVPVEGKTGTLGNGVNIDNHATALLVGFWASIPLDYLLRVTGRGHLQRAEAFAMPVGELRHPFASAMLLRTLRLNCMTEAYAALWKSVYSASWSTETWVVNWPQMPALEAVGPQWDRVTPLRTEYERRAALVEIDALVAAWLGFSVEQLIAIYRARYPILADRDSAMWFDSSGRRLSADPYAFGYGQTKEHFKHLQEHLEHPERVPAPEGYTPPFYKADREAEYRQAHAVFSERLERAKAEGWTPDGESAS
ncbi:class I SAM-dependent DNA methyltransferase [Actinomadura rugatobispora]|uniref:site-specific DNA-methyltransferase (adenine-specific) n=1 Tax=Actinomadura rugatobispora TaxID=1994 RepID=A0ABW1A6H2_9ACTN